MDYRDLFRADMDALKAEGRYRTFAELERMAGDFPNAVYHGPRGLTAIATRVRGLTVALAAGLVTKIGRRNPRQVVRREAAFERFAPELEEPVE